MRYRVLIFSLFFGFAAGANVVGTDAQNFNVTTSGLDFVTVQSSETLEPGIFNLGFFLNLAVNSLPIFQDTQGNRIRFSDALVGADLNIGYGVKENWDVGLSFPQLVYQHIDDNSVYRGFYDGYGTTEIRANTKYRLQGDESQGIAVVVSVNFNRIQNNPYTGINPGPTYNLEFAADKTIDGIAYGVNVGYRFRHSGAAVTGIPIQPFSDQLIASVAASKLIPKYDVKLIAEIFGGMPAQNTDKQDYRAHSSLEALIGAKYDYTRNLAVHFGAGTAIQQGTATPDWRVYSGVNYAFGPISRGPETTVSKKFETTDRIVLDINFEFDSDKITDTVSYNILDELAQYVLALGKYKLVISGHTDSVGSDAYNMNLSIRRANSVRDYLLKKYPKLKADKLVAQGFGETMPIADNGNYQGRQKNRRVEFKIEQL